MENYEWNLEEIFKNENELEEAINKLYKEIENIKKYKGILGESSDNVLKCHQNLTVLLELEEVIYAYAMLKYHKDMSNSNSIKLYKRVEKIVSDLSSAISFISPELSGLEDGKLEQFLEENETLRTEFNKTIQDIIKEKKHILSAEVEEVLANYSEIFSASENAYDIFTNTEFEYPSIKGENGEELEVTDALFSRYLSDKNPNIRKQAFESVYSLYKKHINTITELYLTRVKAKVINSKLRKYKSSLDLATSGDDSTVEVYDTLLKVVNKNLNLNYDYMETKRKLLNIDKLHVYDVYVNALEEEEQNISYEDGKKTVLSALNIMGKDYIDTVQYALDHNWVDVFEKKNKMSGGYSMGVHSVHPYILLNYINTSRDVSTLAHELGHTMHSFYASKNQNIINANYTIMVAEVASTVNEILLANYLINKETDKTKKAVLINEQLDMIRATLIRQSMFAEFEKDVHAKIEANESLTSENLNDIYYELVKKYFGENVIIDEDIKYEWARIPHFYRCFYVYKYATGITSAIVIANKILNHEPGYVEKYINMLSLGGAKGSLELLKMVDVDLEKEDTYEIAFDYFRKNLEELNKLIND
ncbi:MAG: oligoendopeptidase F [Clostridia bacterium]|nr:oligoendopeptidase F [Clostridia bacterium]